MIKNRKFCWLIVLIISVMLSSIVVACKPDEPPHEQHNFGEWICDNLDEYCENREYSRQCECGEAEYKNGSEDDHEYSIVTTEPTCTLGGYDTKTCNICGKTSIENETSIKEHGWEESYYFNISYHWKECADCDSTTERELHEFNSGECKICLESTRLFDDFTVNRKNNGYELSNYTGTEKNIILSSAKYNGNLITSIGNNAFKETDVVSIVVGGDIATIGDYAFENCASLESIELGDQVTTIGDYAFNYCVSLESIELGDQVTTIGSGAFNYCVSLESIELGDSIITIGTSAFSNCYALAKIVIPGSVTSVPAAFGSCDALSYVKIENGVKSLEFSAFSSCRALKTVIMPSSIETVNALAFMGIVGINVYFEGSQEEWNRIVVVESVGISTLMGVTAYYYSESKPQEDGNYWHYDENGKIEIWLKESEGLDFARNGEDFSLSVTGIGECKDTVVVIPQSIEGIPVTKIGGFAFADCVNLTSVVIPKSVTSIDLYAFAGCTNLTSVVIPKSVTSIDLYAFADCVNLTSVVIPDSIQRIGNNAFYGCDDLEYVFYAGTESDWDSIEINTSNESLFAATIYYYSESQPQEDGNYWHYDENGEVAIWEVAVDD